MTCLNLKQKVRRNNFNYDKIKWGQQPYHQKCNFGYSGTTLGIVQFFVPRLPEWMHKT